MADTCETSGLLDELRLTSFIVCVSGRRTRLPWRPVCLFDHLVCLTFFVNCFDAHDVQIRILILLMAFMVISTVYNRVVLRRTGFDQLPTFTTSHACEIWEVCSEFFHSLVDFILAAWNTRTRGFRNVNPASHHWTSRDEEEALRASDPLEPEAEDVRR